MLAIHVADVTVLVRVGVTPEERATPQPLRVSVTLRLPSVNHFVGDSHLDETLDYSRVVEFLRSSLPRGGSQVLIETVAETIAEHCLGLSPRVQGVEVEVAKPSVLGGDGLVSVSLSRHRPHVPMAPAGSPDAGNSKGGLLEGDLVRLTTGEVGTITGFRERAYGNSGTYLAVEVVTAAGTPAFEPIDRVLHANPEPALRRFKLARAQLLAELESRRELGLLTSRDELAFHARIGELARGLM